MARLGKVGTGVLFGACVLLSGCHGKEDQVPVRSVVPAAQPSSLPAGQEGNNDSMAGSKRAIHQRGAAYRREKARRNTPAE
jgi:hypothetical protein